MIEEEQVYQPDIQRPRPMKFLSKKIILDKLGEGSYGKVYKIQDTETREITAIKVFKFKSCENGIHGSSLREISLLQQLHQYRKIENIVEIKSINVLEDEIHLELEFCDTDLFHFIRNNSNNPGVYNLTAIKRIIYQIIKGVSEIHKQRMMHRDLKPGNILIKDGVCKIADFGLARQFTLPHQIYTRKVSTLWYQAPELVIGLGNYSEAVDIWAIGCIFAELICKEPIFPAEDDLSMLRNLVSAFGNFTNNEELLPGCRFFENYQLLQSLNLDEIPFQGFFEIIKSKAKFNVSFEMLDLLNKFLQVDPNKRITCLEALEHPYFTRNENDSSANAFFI